MHKSAILVALAGMALVAQTPAPISVISAYYSLDNAKTYQYRWLQIDPPLAVTVDSTGRPHLGLNNALTVSLDGTNVGSTNTLNLMAGRGVVFMLSNTPQGILIQESVDTSYVTHRVAPPPGPGECLDSITHLTLGVNSWAADATAQYFCVVSEAYPSGLAWAQVPLNTTW